MNSSVVNLELNSVTISYLYISFNFILFQIQSEIYAIAAFIPLMCSKSELSIFELRLAIHVA